MGVTGVGKSAVGAAVAERLGWDFVEGDDLHPPANVAKMASGRPLTDEDRAPWLERVRDQAAERAATGRSTVITCSALRRDYRDVLRTGTGPMFFVHLVGTEELLRHRLSGREHPFMPAALLRSQLTALEPLEPDEDGVTVDVSGTLPEVVGRALAPLTLRVRPSRRPRS